MASQLPKIGGNVGVVAQMVPFYVGFLRIMAFAGWVVARVFRLDPQRGRAMVLTGATGNSLVVRPLALARPDPYAIAAVVIITQTLCHAAAIGDLSRSRSRSFRSVSAPCSVPPLDEGTDL